MIVAIIQARVGSSRLPRKVIERVGDKTLIWHVIQRVKESKLIDKIVLATTPNEKDKILLEKAKEYGVEGFAGSENDVLDRYYQAAKKFKGDVIVRITGDCPLIDSKVVDRVIQRFMEEEADYMSNINPPTYPDGLDVEVFSFAALEKAWKEATLVSEREHVTPYIRKNPQIFQIKNLENDEDLSSMRWTVDEERDLEFVREIHSKLYKEGKIFHMGDVLALLKKHPELMDINRGITRNGGYQKSLEEDERMMGQK